MVLIRLLYLYDIEDIMNVQGIKEGTFTKIKDEIMTG